MTNRFSHADLVAIARSWLSKPWRPLRKFAEKWEVSRWGIGRSACPVIITELVTGTPEQPDAIGFHSGSFTTLVECKASRADFLSDRKKSFRQTPERGMGHTRFYMAPKGMIATEELPEKWGLIEVNEKGNTRVVKPSDIFDRNTSAEAGVLTSLVCRLNIEEDGHVKIRRHSIDDAKSPKATFIVQAVDSPDWQHTPPTENGLYWWREHEGAEEELVGIEQSNHKPPYWYSFGLCESAQGPNYACEKKAIMPLNRNFASDGPIEEGYGPDPGEKFRGGEWWPVPIPPPPGSLRLRFD